MLEMWELEDILNDRRMFVKLLPQKNDFWAPDGDRTRNLLMTSKTLLPLRYQDSDGKLRREFDKCTAKAEATIY